MNIDYIKGLLSTFPKELIQGSESLESLGIYELAWERNNAIKVIEFLSDCNYAILGGDVYSIKNGILNSTYDSWFSKPNKNKTWEDYVKKSKNESLEYINRFFLLNGDDFRYSIVYERK